MSVIVPGCYNTDGTPATADSVQAIIRPPMAEGAQIPTPAQAAKNVKAAIANLTNAPQPGLL